MIFYVFFKKSGKVGLRVIAYYYKCTEGENAVFLLHRIINRGNREYTQFYDTPESFLPSEKEILLAEQYITDQEQKNTTLTIIK